MEPTPVIKPLEIPVEMDFGVVCIFYRSRVLLCNNVNTEPAEHQTLLSTQIENHFGSYCASEC